MEIEKALEEAREPGMVTCPECGDSLMSPMEKLCISLYEKCTIHLPDDSHQEKNLLKIIESL